MGLSSLSSYAVKAFMVHELRASEIDGPIQALAGAPIPSSVPIETYASIGASPALKKWIGGARKTVNLRTTASLTISNEKYQATLRIEGDDLRRDQTAKVQTRIADLRTRYGEHWTKIATDLIIANPVCYDTQNWFDTDHADAGATYTTAQSNAISVTAAAGTTPTVGEMEGAIRSAMKSILGFKDDQGEPWSGSSSTDFLLMTPIDTWDIALGALGASNIIETAGAGARSNILALMGNVRVTLVPNPRLTAADVMYLFATNGRAIIRQTELDLKVTAKAEGSEYEHDNDAHEYGVMTIRGIGPGDWRAGVKVTFT